MEENRIINGECNKLWMYIQVIDGCILLLCTNFFLYNKLRIDFYEHGNTLNIYFE